MAFDQLDEHEQSEIVRNWMRENAASILVGIVLGLLVIFGYFQWQGHQARQRAAASTEFLSFNNALGAKNDTAAQAALDKIRQEYGDSAYAVVASLRSAEAAVARKDLAAAEQSLQWAYEHAKGDALKGLTGLNLASVKLGADKAAEALALLDTLPSAGYAAPIAELRGDILLAQGQRDAARTAYQASLDALDATSPLRQSLEMKRDDAAGAATAAAPATPAPATAPAAPAPAPAAPAAAAEKQSS